MMGLRYFLAIVCPPLAVLFCWRPFSAVLNILLTLFGYFPGRAHAFSICNQFYYEKRNSQQLKAINHPTWVNQILSQPRDSKLELPPIRRVKEVEAPETTYNDPGVGIRGTRFRKRG